jgi:hypothetical protein
MKKKEPKKGEQILKITPIRKATPEELAAIPLLTKGSKINLGLIGITHHPELDGNGKAFFPTHNFDSIKKYRESLYEIVLNSTLRERAILGLKTDSDLKKFRITWLWSELKWIEHFIDSPLITLNGTTEVNEYKNYVNRELNSNKKKNPTRDDPSIVRAKAFCIALMQQNGKDNFLKEGGNLMRDKIMDFAKKTWGKPGRTIYNECLNIISERNPINKFYKEDNIEEYEIGLKFYKEMYPD